MEEVVSKENIIKIIKRRMGEPLIKYLTDEEYNVNYDLITKMLDYLQPKLNISEDVMLLCKKEMLGIICEYKIEIDEKNK